MWNACETARGGEKDYKTRSQSVCCIPSVTVSLIDELFLLYIIYQSLQKPQLSHRRAFANCNWIHYRHIGWLNTHSKKRNTNVI